MQDNEEAIFSICAAEASTRRGKSVADSGVWKPNFIIFSWTGKSLIFFVSTFHLTPLVIVWVHWSCCCVMHKYQLFNKNYKARVPNRVCGPVPVPRPVTNQAAGQDASRGERAKLRLLLPIFPHPSHHPLSHSPILSGENLSSAKPVPSAKKVGDRCPKAVVLTAQDCFLAKKFSEITYHGLTCYIRVFQCFSKVRVTWNSA